MPSTISPTSPSATKIKLDTFEKRPRSIPPSYLAKTGRILSWITGNIGYHHIHHLNHRVPFYRLPEVYRAIPELRAAKTTTLRPADIFRCLPPPQGLVCGHPAHPSRPQGL